MNYKNIKNMDFFDPFFALIQNVFLMLYLAISLLYNHIVIEQKLRVKTNKFLTPHLPAFQTLAGFY